MQLLLGLFVSAVAFAGPIRMIEYSALRIPVTPFSNMASGYQATNPGFRAVLRSKGGDFIGGGPITMDAVIKGETDDASRGSAYGQLVLNVDVIEAYPGITHGVMQGEYSGYLSICMAEDPDSKIQDTRCKNLSGNIHPERPFQWLNKQVDFVVEGRNIRITKYYGDTGEGGTSRQLSLATFHPAYGFAAPGKAFKDYQSPLVLDLDGNGRLDLVNVWDEAPVVRFDLEASGNRTRTGWVREKDAFLFWDNGTGCVSSGRDLFGEYFQGTDGKRTFKNGFLALASVAKSKHQVNAAALPKLKIWRDRSQDGVCTPDEVVAASKVIRTIDLSYKTIANPPLTDDNEIRLTGTFTTRKGEKRVIGDVWFKQRRHELTQK